ncbi:MAG: ABC transporter substrate-binding protein [Oscillospiraceae bacterium]|nr:ABC transporter substrate-binding protein [Oscillospiraceae bacterium]
MKKWKWLALVCAAAMLLCACGGAAKDDGTVTVTGSKGDEYKVTEEAIAVTTDENVESEYEPYTITLNLERSGIGQNMEETFTAAPTHAVADGDQMADMLFDLGLADHMAGFTRGACLSTVSEYPARDTVRKLTPDGVNLRNATKETLIDTGCDFMMGWDSLFSENNFSVSFCLEHGIIPYFPYCCSDSATFEDIFKDYEVLGNIFGVQEVAAERIAAMKETLERVKATLGDDIYANPIRVFVYDSGEDAPFTACQGMPGDMIKPAGGISIFDDIQKGWATPSWEEVVERDPDVILILNYDYEDTETKTEFLKNNEFTSQMRAVQEGRIYVANCADMQGSAGSAGTVEIMARQFYPELFE